MIPRGKETPVNLAFITHKMVEVFTKSKITLFMDKHNALDKSCQGKSCFTNPATVSWRLSKHVANGCAEYTFKRFFIRFYNIIRETKSLSDSSHFWTEAAEMVRNHTLQDSAAGGPWILKSVILKNKQNILRGNKTEGHSK